MILAFAFFAVLTVNCQETDDGLECLVNYLRLKNLDDEVFEYVKNSSLSDSCKRKINAEMEKVYSEAVREYEKNGEFELELDCFLKSIERDEHLNNLMLKRNAIDSVKLSWLAKLNPVNWFPGKKSRALREVESNISTIEFDALFSCEYGKKFEIYFDSIVEVQKFSPKRREVANCTKKYLEDWNERKVDIKASKVSEYCKAVMKEMTSRIFINNQNFYIHKKAKVSNCITDLLTGSLFFLPEFRVKSFAEDLSVAETISIRQAYVSEMKDLFREVVRKCN